MIGVVHVTGTFDTKCWDMPGFRVTSGGLISTSVRQAGQNHVHSHAIAAREATNQIRKYVPRNCVQNRSADTSMVAVAELSPAVAVRMTVRLRKSRGGET